MRTLASVTLVLQLALSPAAPASPPAADGGSALVITPTGALSGSLELQSDGVRVTGDDGSSVTVPHAEIFRLALGRHPLRVRGPQAVRLRNGEIWQAEIVALQGRRLSVRSSLFGDHAVPVEDVATLDFAPDLPWTRDARSGWLYREAGEPTPGELLSLDRDRLAIDSPLGVLTLPREGLSRYVLPSPPPGGDAAPSDARDGADEIRLADGSLLRGRLTLDEGGVVLEHGTFGTLRLPRDAILEIDRHHPRIIDLVESEPAGLQQQPLTSGPPREAGLRRLRGLEAGASRSPRYVRALRVEAHTTVRYAFAGPSARTLRTVIEAPAEGRGEAVVRIGTGERTLLETRVRPHGDPERVELGFQAGDDIVIEVDFGERIRFPCAVVLADPILVLSR